MKKKEEKALKFSLLSNGLDFIASALEHLKDTPSYALDPEYKGKPSQRDLKYAVLHLCSGIELVLKERLQWEHWTLVFDNPAKANKEDFGTGDFTSVSFKDCIEKLVNICGVDISEKHKRTLLRFRDKRNRFEHFGIVDSAEAITASAAETLNFLVDFINSELHPEELKKEDSEALAEIRQKLGAFSKFVSKRTQTIKSELEKATTAVVTCPSCFVDAAILEDGANCLFCGYKESAEAAASEYVSAVLGEDYYRVIKDGGEYPLYSCPQCESETLVDRGKSGSQSPEEQFICFQCGTSWKEGVLDFCMECGQPYNPGDGGMAICDTCFEYKVKSDD